MDSKKQTFTLDYIFPPSPTTEQAQPAQLQANINSKTLVYCVSNLVVLRKLPDLYECEVFSEHKFATTCAQLNPKGTYVCSADIMGNILIWDAINPAHVIFKALDNYLGGPVKDICWTQDGQRVGIAGQGKQVFAKVFSFDTGATLGEISGPGKLLLSCDLRPNRPFQFVTCGMEYTTFFFEGPPFKFKKSQKPHTNFVNCIRFNQTGSRYVSVGSDKKIFVYESDTGNVLKQHGKDCHAGGIMSCDFKDENLFATSSADKTVQIWDLGQQEFNKTLNVQTEGATVKDQQLSVVFAGEDLISVSLNGSVNLWNNVLQVDNGSLPSQRFPGHQSSISDLLTDSKGNIYSSDNNGRIIKWVANSENKRLHPVMLEDKNEQQVAKLQLSASGRQLFVLTSAELVKLVDTETFKIVGETAIKGQLKDIIASKEDDNLAFVLNEQGIIHVLQGATVSSDIQIPGNANAFALNPKETQFAIGDTKGLVNIISRSDGKVLQTIEESNTRITNLAWSGNGDLLIIADTTNKMKLWSFKQEKNISEQFCFHTAVINSIVFSQSNKYLVTGAMDNKIIVWDLTTLEKETEIPLAHKNGIFRVTFLPNGSILSGGGDALIKIFTTNTKYD